VQGQIALLPARLPVDDRHPAPHPPQGAAHVAGQLALRRAAGPLGQRRVGQQRVEGVVQRQVAVAVQGGQRPLPGLGLPPGERPVQGGGDRPEHQLGWQLVDHLAEPLGHHLAVAGRGQLAGEPLQLLGQRPGGVAVQHPPVGLHGAAQPTARHPHLVHRVGGVPADQRIESAQPVGLLTQVREHGRAGGVARVGLRPVGVGLAPVGGALQPIGEDPAQL
jgi:hypothetical protein